MHGDGDAVEDASTFLVGECAGDDAAQRVRERALDVAVSGEVGNDLEAAVTVVLPVVVAEMRTAHRG
jgi:hypothetical protein